MSTEAEVLADLHKYLYHYTNSIEAWDYRAMHGRILAEPTNPSTLDEIIYRMWNHNSTPPTSTQLMAITPTQVEDSMYYEYRRREYPNVREQLDLLYHDINNNNLGLKNLSWFTKIKNIKDNHPKPV